MMIKINFFYMWRQYRKHANKESRETQGKHNEKVNEQLAGQQAWELPGTSVHAILLDRKGVLQAYAVKKPRTKPKQKFKWNELVQ